MGTRIIIVIVVASEIITARAIGVIIVRIVIITAIIIIMASLLVIVDLNISEVLTGLAKCNRYLIIGNLLCFVRLQFIFVLIR
jgi:hypothetical protein